MGDTGRTLACPGCRKPCLRGSKFCAHCGALLSGFELDLVDLDGDGSLLPGTLVGSYRLVDVLGAGGMGRVYLAEHIKLGRRVAIKRLRRELVSNPGAVARFFAEARAVNRIFHENIVEITDMIEQPGGDNCIIMELLKGEDLAHRLRGVRTLPLVRAFGIAAQIASALAAVHAAGMIHRDLKPDNIFLIERAGNPDFVKVLDFGVAKLTGADDRSGVAMHTTAAGQIVGTPEYMSPEQARGEPVDFRADIYALGVIIYEMITGALPFQAKSFGELMIRHMTASVEMPSHQSGLAPVIQSGRDRLLLDLLAKDPAGRPASMADVERRLRELVDAMMLPPRPDPVRSSPASRSGAEAVAKVALVKRPTSLVAVELATPRSVSRIDVLTPSSIGLGSIAKPLIPPPMPLMTDPARSAAHGELSSPERLAKSSSDAHAPAEPRPSAAASAGTQRSSTEPGRKASAPGASDPDLCASGTPAHAVSSNPAFDAAWAATARAASIAPPAAIARPTLEAPASGGPSTRVAPAIGAWRRVVLGVGLVIALAGVSVAFQLGRPLEATTAPAAQPSEVKIKFVSAPPGAEVRLVGTGELLGITPLTRSFPRSARAATFELAKPGFATVTQDIALAGDDAVAVALTPVTAAPPSADRPPDPNGPVDAR